MPRALFLPAFYPSPSRPLNGAFFAAHARAVREVGWDVHVVYVEDRGLSTFFWRPWTTRFQFMVADEDGVPTYRVRGWNPLAQTTPGGLLWTRLTLFAAHKYTRFTGIPDIIHAHNALWSGHAARLLAAQWRLPYVVTEHSSAVLMRELSSGALKHAVRAWKGASGVSAVSSALANVVRDEAASTVAVTPNPIDTAFFVLPPAEPEWGRRFVCVANLNQNKRVDLLLRAFAQVLARDPNAWLEIVGSGPEGSRLKRMAADMALAHRVAFLGAVDAMHMRAALWRATCLVSPSNFETFGMAVAEALATGLPVIATRSGGPEEIVRPEDGSLVPRGDADALATAMFESPPVTRDSRLRRREGILRRYSPAIVGEQHIVMYRRAVERRFEAQQKP